jgi:glycine/D-amino acid oxidase-like deaminating enzyme
MIKVDYLIVGSGLAGILFCEVLKQHGKTFVVVDNNSQQSSTVAGGLYNPVILKRFTEVWKAKEQLNLALPMYQVLEKTLGIKLNYQVPIYRLFASVEEQNNWFAASDKPNLSEFLSTTLIQNKNKAITCNYGFGEVLKTGRIHTSALVSKYKDRLENKEVLIKETFDYDSLQIEKNIIYKTIEAKQVVFAEGFGMQQNPFFKYLPLKPTKGELLTIYAPNLKIDYILKSSVFIMPLRDDLYLVGATYEWEDLTNTLTKKARQELLDKLKTVLKCEFKVIDQVAGIRPTVKDRRPLVGQHPKHNNVYGLNGLGTRGVMIAPYVAHQLYNFIEKGLSLNTEIDIKRFK